MKEYIERKEALRQIFLEAMGHDFDFNAEYRKIYISAKRAVRNTPAADVVKVRHGRWEWNENAMDWGLGGWVCSECRAKNDNIPAKPDIHPSAWVGSHYCPNCGACMDKEDA